MANDISPVFVVFNLECTTAQYDQVWEELNRSDFFDPENVIFHAGCTDGESVKVFDIWPSAEFEAFFEENVAPIIRGTGAKVSWDLYPVRKLLSQKHNLSQTSPIMA